MFGDLGDVIAAETMEKASGDYFFTQKPFTLLTSVRNGRAKKKYGSNVVFPNDGPFIPRGPRRMV